MACKHEWKTRASGKKEDCQKCGAARMVGTGPCADGGDHDWVFKGKKDRCTKCGAGRGTLKVRDSIMGNESPKIKG